MSGLNRLQESRVQTDNGHSETRNHGMLSAFGVQ
jgi:hypothetical protein